MDEQLNSSEQPEENPQPPVNSEPPFDPNAVARAMSEDAGREEAQPRPQTAAATPQPDADAEADAAMAQAMVDEAEDDASPVDNTSVQMPGGPAEIRRADFGELDSGAYTSPSGNIELLLDVDLPVAIELGRTQMSIKDILELGAGSIVELDKLAGEPVDILVNSRPLAKGEVVVLDEHFGVRITSLVSPRERIETLGA